MIAWKTSPRFVGTGLQRQPSVASVLSSSSTGGSSGTLEWPGRHAAALSSYDVLRGHAASYDVMLQGVPAASQQLLQLNRVSLGLLLGAGAR
jgi:hypothetical protein